MTFGAAALMLVSANAFAQTQTTFYGLLDVFAGGEKPVGAASRSTGIDSSGMSTSYLGVGVSTDLAPGVTGIAAAEAFVTPATGDVGRFTGDHMFARDAYIGAKGSYGQLTAGRNTSPYFLSVIFYNPFVDSFVFSPAILQTYLGYLDGDTGWSNSVVYSTPQIGGFNGSLAYAKAASVGAESNFSGTAFYNIGKFSATLAYEKIGVNTNPNVPAGNSQKSGLLGASYDFGVAKLFGEFQKMTNSAPTGKWDQTLGQVGASVSMGSGDVLVSYARTTGTGLFTFHRDTAALGYDFNVSKSLDVYVAYLHDKVSDTTKGAGTGDTVGVGGRLKF
ncbi:MAG: porin [Acidiferrobacterales bacterium]